jgi:hypothetical protein
MLMELLESQEDSIDGPGYIPLMDPDIQIGARVKSGLCAKNWRKVLRQFLRQLRLAHSIGTALMVVDDAKAMK